MNWRAIGWAAIFGAAVLAMIEAGLADAWLSFVAAGAVVIVAEFRTLDAVEPWIDRIVGIK